MTVGSRDTLRGGALALVLAAACTAPSAPMRAPGDHHVSAERRSLAEPSARSLPRDEAERRLAHGLAARDPFAVVVFGNRVLAAGGSLDQDAPSELAAAVDALDRELLTAAYEQLDPAQAPADEVALRLARLALHAGDSVKARRWAAQSRRDEARELEAALARHARVVPDVVALLVPLSGIYEPLGREIEAAVRLAVEAHRGVRVTSLDTNGDEATAVAAVERAVTELGAVAILGPVGHRTGLAAARRAAALDVPIALLAAGGEGGAPEVGVFRMWPDATAIAAAAALAAVERGFDAFGILAPRDAYGADQADAFRAAAEAAGARVVAQGSYDPSGSDLEPDIKRFLGLVPAANERLRKHLRANPDDGWKTFSPDVPFDLLYIPDDHERAALVAAYLPFFNVELRTSRELVDTLALRRKHGGRVPSPVQLMGSPGWHHPALLTAGGGAVDGALIVDVCVGSDAEAFTSEGAAAFAGAFEQRRGRPPSPVARQAYDAATMLFVARGRALERAAAGADPRRAVRDALAGAQLDDGACGPAKVAPDGSLVREAVVLRIDGGAFIFD